MSHARVLELMAKRRDRVTREDVLDVIRGFHMDETSDAERALLALQLRAAAAAVSPTPTEKTEQPAPSPARPEITPAPPAAGGTK